MEHFTRETFAPYLGEVFRFSLGADVEIDLVLGEATALTASTPPPGRRSAFSLIFRGSASHELAQGTYPVHHRQIGTFALFIVPVARSGDTVNYEAIFA